MTSKTTTIAFLCVVQSCFAETGTEPAIELKHDEVDFQSIEATDFPFPDILQPPMSEIRSSRVLPSSFLASDCQGYSIAWESHDSEVRMDLVLSAFNSERDSYHSFLESMIDHCYGEFWDDANRERVDQDGTESTLNYSAYFVDDEFHGSVHSHLDALHTVTFFIRGMDIESLEEWDSYETSVVETWITRKEREPNQSAHTTPASAPR